MMQAATCLPHVRSRYAGLVASSLLVAFAFQGARGLYEPSEGRYAEVAREMRESGNYLEPTLDYRPHWTKPPLTYWAIAAGLAAFGNNAWGVRAYNAIAFSVTTLTVTAIGATLWNPEAGFIAGLIYASSPFPALGAGSATADMLLAMWLALALLAYVRAWRGLRVATSARLMWLMFGLGFFTKGPPALLPLLALVVFHLVARRPFRFFDPAGLVLFVVSAFWWFALVASRHHELLRYFVGKEIVARNTSDTFHRNGQWYGAFVAYVPVLVLGSGAWLIDLVRTARTRHLYSPRRLWDAIARRNSVGSLLLLWTLVPLAVFALSKSRLPLYLLPLYAAFAIALARAISMMYGPGARRHVVRYAAVSMIALVGLKAAVAYLPRKEDAARVYREAARLAGPNAQFALFANAGAFGFQFYAGKEMRRLSESASEPWADGRVVDAVQSRDPGRALAIVTGSKRAAELDAALNVAHASFSRTEIPGNVIFVLPAPPAN